MWKVKKDKGVYLVGREEKNQFGSISFITPYYGRNEYKTLVRAKKRAYELNMR